MEILILYQSNYPKFRYGRNHDGGYVIVDLPNNYDLFLSGGIANDISFEQAFLKKYSNLLCFAFDGTINSLPKNNIKNIKFIKKNLGNKNDDNITDLCEYMHNFNNIFMKMDIEGHEFRIMPVLIKNNYMNKIKQLVIEIHSPADIQLYPEYFKGLSDITNDIMFNLFREINKTHTLVHFHANNGCKMTQIDGINIPHVFELTHIRNDFVKNKIKNTETLPTKLDSRNIRTKKDYTLQGFPYSFNLKD